MTGQQQKDRRKALEVLDALEKEGADVTALRELIEENGKVNYGISPGLIPCTAFNTMLEDDDY